MSRISRLCDSDMALVSSVAISSWSSPVSRYSAAVLPRACTGAQLLQLVRRETTHITALNTNMDSNRDFDKLESAFSWHKQLTTDQLIWTMVAAHRTVSE
jgi:hypothetical protein